MVYDAEIIEGLELDVYIGGEKEFSFMHEYEQNSQTYRYSRCELIIEQRTEIPAGQLTGTLDCTDLLHSPDSPTYVDDPFTFGPAIDLTVSFVCPYTVQ